MKIEFKSVGKAFLSAGPATAACTYSESGKTVSLICVGDKTVFTIEDMGAKWAARWLADATKKK